jgi:hypothetical protein
MTRLVMIAAVLVVFNFSCSDRKHDDENKIEDDFEQSKQFEIIKEYVEKKEDFGNEYYWDMEYKILRHLILGDSLVVGELAQKIFQKAYLETREKLVYDSLGLKPVKQIANENDKCRLLRVIVETSFIPFKSVLTIVEIDGRIKLFYKVCLLSYQNPLTGEDDGEYELDINGERVKGRFIMVKDTSGEISNDRYHDLVASLPRHKELKDDYEFKYGRMLDGEYIIIESLDKYSDEIIDYRKYAAQIGGFSNTLDSLVKKALEEFHCRTQKVYGKFFENWKGIGIALSE